MGKRLTVGPVKQAEAVVKHKAMVRTNRENLRDRLLTAYHAESDRVYAEEFYGSMLRELGVSI